MRECECLICRGVPDAELDSYYRGTVGHIAEFGWSVPGVFADDRQPGWAYTVGLWHSFGHPELAMFGLPHEGLQPWLNIIGGRIEGGERFDAGARAAGVLDGFDVQLESADGSWHEELFGVSLGFYGSRVSTYHVVWPDRHGIWPWEPGATESCVANQPRLKIPFDAHPDSVWTSMPAGGECTCGCAAADDNWPFEQDKPDTLVFTTKALADGGGTIVGIVHNHDSSWEFHHAIQPGEPSDATDITRMHLSHLVAQHPVVSDFSLLPCGRTAWLEDDGDWKVYDVEDE